MTPEEKAKELIEKFSKAATQYDFNEIRGWFANEKETEDNAKKCAIICVEEILNLHSDIWISKEQTEYWQQVKNYLEL